MELVIKIPDTFYETIKSDKYGVHQGRIYDIIRNGTLLPKEHGDLVDRDAINERFYDICKEAYNCPNQPTDKYVLDKLSMCLDTVKPTIKANYE